MNTKVLVNRILAVGAFLFLIRVRVIKDLNFTVNTDELLNPPKPVAVGDDSNPNNNQEARNEDTNNRTEKREIIETKREV